MALTWLIIFLIATGILAYQRASLIIWTISFFILFVLHDRFAHANGWLLGFEFFIFLVVAALLNLRPLRQKLITRHILGFFQQQMPSMSRTEKEALEAGTISWEGNLFSGAPEWEKLLKQPQQQLTSEEQAFLDGPANEVCRMANDWDITHNHADLPPQIWQFLKDNGFFGLIIPKQYGGKQFSALAHSAILVKLYSRSVTLAVTVSVPNSLGPAELLLHYGTEEQKNYYLPRLARGEEIPCFALTNPEAGSDASSIPDNGIICRGNFEGKEIIGIRLNWDKRYITLAPVASVLGLAFKLYDPEQLIGTQKEYGITCALIPTTTPGITIGRRHFPLNAAFQNGPTQGKDVFIPLDWIIGGIKMAGQGWRMLVECLSAGRSISLPSSGVSGGKFCSVATGAYARIRKQFNFPIGKFEGIEEALARVGGYAYMMDAALKLTLSAIDRGEKPAVLSAIMKYHATEYARKIVIDAMDVHAGKGICLGPYNYLGRGYQSAPISITVEGANILTRSLIIFGQGAIRCHPYILAEMEAARDEDKKRSLQNFDKALFSHIGYSISNIVRGFVLAVSNARWTRTPQGNTQRYFQKFSRYSAALALCADFAMLTLGGDLKRKEKLSARLGDVLSDLYIGSAVLKQYHDQGQPAEDFPLVEWTCQYLIHHIQQQLDGLLRNLPIPWLRGVLNLLIFPWGHCEKEPSDKLGHQIADLLLHPNPARSRLAEGLFLDPVSNNPLGFLEQALPQAIAAEPLEKTIRTAVRKGEIEGSDFIEQVKAAAAANIITSAEAEQLFTVEKLRKEIIKVDDFAPEELAR